MSDVTKILQSIEQGNGQATGDLFPLVYAELRRLASGQMMGERTDHTLSATALVHEAYVRLVDVNTAHGWQSRRHFFAAAAEAMRRLLVDYARRRKRIKRGGAELERRDWNVNDLIAPSTPEETLAVHDALDGLESVNADAAQLVKLRYFAGMTIPEAAEILSVSPRKATQIWSYARAWLLAEMHPEAPA